MGYLKWIVQIIFKTLSISEISDLVVKLIKEMVSRSENSLDEAALNIISEILYSSIGQDREQKLSELDSHFK